MWNIGYSEVLKMDKKNHFQKLSDSVNGKELEEILSEFFNIVETGVHILILCSNQPEKISKEELTEIIYVFLTIFLYLLKCPQSLIL